MLKLAYYFVFLLLILGQFTSISKSTGVSIYLFDLAAAALAVYGIFCFLLTKDFYLSREYHLFIAFLLMAALSLLYRVGFYSIDQLLISSFYIVRYAAYLITGVVLYNMLVSKELAVDYVLRLIIYSGVLLALFGFIQLALLPDFEVLDAALGWDPHKNRLASTFFDPNFVAAYLNICLAILLSDILSSKQRLFFSLPARLLVLFLFLSALVMTFSRSGWLMTGVIILILGFKKSKYLLLIALIIGFLAYFAVPRIQTRISGVTDPADSAHFRLVSWENTLNIAQDNLFLGVGFNAFRYAQMDYGYFEPGTLGGNAGAGSDSSLLLVLATTGILGFFIYLCGYVKLIISSLKSEASLDLVVLSMLLGLFINSFFINTLFYPQILFLFFILISLSSYEKLVSRT